MLRRICIEPTNMCNLNCKQCWSNNAKREKGFMDFAFFKKIVEEAVAINIQGISLNYSGESTLHPEFGNMIREIKQHNIPMSFTTNGINITDDILDALKDSNITIGFSLHSNLEKVFENITKIKSVIGIRKIGATVGVGEHSTKELKWIKENCPCNVFEMPVIKNMKWYKIPSNFIKVPYTACDKIHRSTYILWDGKVTICCRDIACEMAFGDIKKDGILNTWNSEYYINLRKDITLKKFTGLCKKCNIWKFKFENKV